MLRILAVLLLLAHATVAAAQARYYPGRFDWQRRTADQSGMNASAVDSAVKFAIANENPAPKDLALAHAARRKPAQAHALAAVDRAPQIAPCINAAAVGKPGGCSRIN